MKTLGKKGGVIIAVCGVIVLSFLVIVEFAMITLQPSIFFLFD